MKQLVMVTGAGGQLGEAMAAQFAARHEVVALRRHELDLSDANAVQSTVGAVCPDVIVNCAAFTNVDAAEREPVQALSANAWAVRTLARAAIDINATLVHFSTDFVFDGTLDRPYTEEDAPNPRGTYAVSKLLGEWFAFDVPTHYVLRVESLFGGPRGASSIDKMLRMLHQGEEVRAFSDRTVSPSFVDDVVAATMGLARTAQSLRSLPLREHRLDHVGESGTRTRAYDRLPNAPIKDIPMADAALLAPRPRFAALSNRKLLDEGIDMPTWQSALSRYTDGVRPGSDQGQT
jgi:dTDP-4-dehydrorhamnose reductase